MKHVAALLVASLCACAPSRAELSVTFPAADGGLCEAQTDLRCVNFLRFTVHDSDGFTSRCIKVDQKLANLCEVSKLAEGQELFKLKPDSQMSIKIEGLRAFPAISCDSQNGCGPRIIFSGQSRSVRIGDVAGGSLEIPVEMDKGCGPPESFFFISQGTCPQLCGSQELVACDFSTPVDGGVSGGCLCKSTAL